MRLWRGIQQHGILPPNAVLNIRGYLR